VRKLIALLFLSISIGVNPSSASQVVLEKITQEEFEALQIEIPIDLAPGYHEMIIEIFNDQEEVVEERLLAFCKTYDGEISWDNSCQDLVELVDPSTLDVIELRSDLPEYVPASEPEKTVDSQVAAFAVLSVVAAGGAAAGSLVGSASRNSSRVKEEEEKEEERESGDVASADAGKLKFYQDSDKWGDQSRLWKLAFVPTVERKLITWNQGVSKIWPLGSRILLDGAYLRAMFSSLALLPALGGLVIGLMMLIQRDFQAMPAVFSLMAIALLFSTLDALAGLTIAGVVLLGVLLSGNATTLDEFMTVLGLAGILLTPGLVASAIRPLRRKVIDFESGWERATDYLLGILLGGWAVEKIVGALNGLAGVQLPITADSERLGLLTSIFILIRLLLEDLATYSFPARLAGQEAKLKDPFSIQPWVSLFFKTTLFFLVSYQFLGLTTQLILGTVLFLTPNILKLVSKKIKIKKTSILSFILPKGAPKIVIMVFVGAFFASWMQSIFSSPESFILWSFVVLAIPSVIFGVLGLFSDAPERDWKETKIGSVTYRVGGVVIASLIFAMYQGANLFELVFGR
jgi:hypothetical protein